jgi:hypothetical protein
MESHSQKSSLKWVPSLTESKKNKSKSQTEEQEQLTIVTLSDEALEESEPNGAPENGDQENGSSKGAPEPSRPPDTFVHGAVHKGCWVSFEVMPLLSAYPLESCLLERVRGYTVLMVFLNHNVGNYNKHQSKSQLRRPERFITVYG